MMVIGTATAVGVALSNDRTRVGRTVSPAVGFAPAFVAPTPPPRSGLPAAAVMGALKPRDFLARQLAFAAALTLVVIAAVGALPAIGAFASGLRSSSLVAVSSPAALSSEPQRLDYARTWAASHSIAIDPGVELQKGLVAIARDTYNWSVLSAMVSIADDRAAARQEAAAAASRPAALAPSYSVSYSPGYAPGTVLRARITIYGCTGPGGGFCNHMASGGGAFEGAAACSGDLPFGTKLKISGDPTGRVYECLDRGSLTPTWIDVYFSDTSDGMAWQSALGGTVATIQIVN